MKKKMRMTRDNFDAHEVLLQFLDCSPGETRRLLEEACHVVIRQQVKIDTFKRKAAELHAVTIGGKP